MAGKSWRFKLGVIVVTSVMLEVLQYILGIGASDITDVITNTFGGAVGSWCCIRAFQNICKELEGCDQ